MKVKDATLQRLFGQPVYVLAFTDHLRLAVWPFQTVNLPLGGHRILVIGRGRLKKDSTFSKWGICCYKQDLEYCCGRDAGGS